MKCNVYEGGNGISLSSSSQLIQEDSICYLLVSYVLCLQWLSKSASAVKVDTCCSTILFHLFHGDACICFTFWLHLNFKSLAGCLHHTIGLQIVCAKVREGDNRIVRIKEGDPAGRHVVIVDDLVQSGGTLIECQVCKSMHMIHVFNMLVLVSVWIHIYQLENKHQCLRLQVRIRSYWFYWFEINNSGTLIILLFCLAEFLTVKLWERERENRRTPPGGGGCWITAYLLKLSLKLLVVGRKFWVWVVADDLIYF